MTFHISLMLVERATSPHGQVWPKNKNWETKLVNLKVKGLRCLFCHFILSVIIITYLWKGNKCIMKLVVRLFNPNNYKFLVFWLLLKISISHFLEKIEKLEIIYFLFIIGKLQGQLVQFTVDINMSYRIILISKRYRVGSIFLYCLLL